MLRKLSIGLVCAFAIVACSNTINGVLESKEALTFNVKKKAVSIPAGKYETKVKAAKKEVTLEIKVPGQKKATEVSFKVPKGAQLPENNGEFVLTADQSGQPYDVKGSIKTTHVDGPERWDWESCTYEVQRQECWYQGGQPVCRWVYYTVHGQRDSRYFIRDTTQVVAFDLVNATAAAAGSFSGTDRYSQRIYTYQGMCR